MDGIVFETVSVGSGDGERDAWLSVCSSSLSSSSTSSGFSPSEKLSDKND